MTNQEDLQRIAKDAGLSKVSARLFCAYMTEQFPAADDPLVSGLPGGADRGVSDG